MSVAGYRILAGILLHAVIVLNIFTSTSQMLRKATPPFDFFNTPNGLEALLADSNRVTFLSLNGVRVTNTETVEVICDMYEAGDVVNAGFAASDRIFTKEVSLTRFYPAYHVWFQVVIAGIFMLVGSYVLYKQPKEIASFIFYLSCIGTATIVTMTWGTAKTVPVWLGETNRALFHLAYVIVPVLFVHFSMVYPVNKERKLKYLLIVLYLLAVLFFSINFASWLLVRNSLTAEDTLVYVKMFDHSRLFILAMVILAIGIFIHSYVKTGRIEDRKRLLWLLSGFLIGPLGFVTLWVIPQALTGEGLVSESFVSSLMLAIPVTFTISIVKYHFLDIDLIINRSLVYIIVILFFGTVYFALLIGLSILISENLELKTAAFVIVIFSLVFHPLRNRVQSEVDRLFFRVRYNFKESLVAFQKLSLPGFTDRQIAGHLASSLLTNIPLGRLLISEYESSVKDKDLYFSSGDEVRLPDKLVVENMVYSRRGSIESRIDHELLPEEIEDLDLTVLISLPLTPGRQLVLALGDKRSGFQFSGNDIEFISAMAKSSADAISAIKLREDLVRKEMEKGRLEELNKQKSLFVSSVSHDLKTPLTSINLLAQQMKRKQDIPEEKKSEYLDVIIGETERLTRLIDNVLDFSRIERGISGHILQLTDLKEVIRKVLGLMEYQLKSENFTMNTSITEDTTVINGNSDALVECLINLLTNSIKFSGKSKSAELTLERSGGEAIITIIDKGIGMKREEKDKLFTPYFRSETSIKKRIPGTGLGLSIVKNIVDSHEGRIGVESAPGEGTTFKLYFKVAK